MLVSDRRSIDDVGQPVARKSQSRTDLDPSSSVVDDAGSVAECAIIIFTKHADNDAWGLCTPN
jgi:hypothetical protein